MGSKLLWRDLLSTSGAGGESLTQCINQYVHRVSETSDIALWQRERLMDIPIEWELQSYRFIDLYPAVVEWQDSLRSELDHFSLRLPRALLPGAHLHMETAMLEESERRLLEAEYFALEQKLSDQGLQGPGYTEDEIKSLTVRELRQVIKTLMALARTPGGR